MMSLRGLFQLSKSKFFLGRHSIFNTTVHNINNARVVITNRRMSMDNDMDNNISSIFTEDNLGMVEKGSIISITKYKVGMVEEKVEEGTTIGISGSKMKSDQVGSQNCCLHHRHHRCTTIIISTITRYHHQNIHHYQHRHAHHHHQHPQHQWQQEEE